MRRLLESLDKISSSGSYINSTLLDSILDPLPYAIFQKDAFGRWLYVNDAAKKLFRFTDAEWLHKTDFELAECNPNLRDFHLRCIDTDAEAWANKTLTRSFEYGLDEQGCKLEFEVHKLPVFNRDQEPEGIFVIANDITRLKSIERDHLQDLQIKEQINQILLVSLEDAPLDSCLDRILNILIESPFINLKKKGAILLSSDDGTYLRMANSVNVSEEQQSLCSHVVYGTCLCGKAAQTRSTIFCSNITPDHNPGSPDIADHGHYCVPILFQAKLLGVLVVYLNPGHQNSADEVTYLESVAHIIAGLLNRKLAEQQLRESLKYLYDADRINALLIKSGDNTSLDAVFRELLDEMRQIFEAERTWLVYPCDPDAPSWKMVMKSHDKKHPGAFEIGQEYPKIEEDRVFDTQLLSSNAPTVMQISRNERTRVGDAARNTYEASIAVVVRPRIGKAWILGIDHCDHDHEWTKHEIRLLSQLSPRFAETINSFLLHDELKNSESKYKSLSETAMDIIISYDVQGNIQYLNSVGISFFGLDAGNYYRRNIFEFIAPNYIQVAHSRQAYFSTGRPFSGLIALDLIAANGDHVPFEVNCSSVTLQNGQPGVISSFSFG
jgi:PAS domain S-box-containing protein